MSLDGKERFQQMIPQSPDEEVAPPNTTRRGSPIDKISPERADVGTQANGQTDIGIQASM